LGQAEKTWAGEEANKKCPGWAGWMCLGSSPKQLEQPHPELVHWWLAG
jgi:hypothetical protein